MLFSENKWDIKLLKVMSINSISIIVRLISGFILSKFLALNIGPSGFGIIGNLRSFINGLQTFGTLGFYNGVIKYSSENKTNKNELKKLISTVFFLSLFIVLLTSSSLFIFADFISELILNTSQYSIVIKLLAFSLPFLTGNYICLSILNGFSEHKRYVTVNIISSIIGLLLSIFLIVKFNLLGILISLVVIPFFLLGISFVLLSTKINIVEYISVSSISIGCLKKLSEYSLMALLSIVLVPPTIIAIRNHLIEVDGINNMGLWESMNRISNYYLMFVTTLLSLYLYPELSKSISNKETKKIILKFSKTLFPVVIVGLFSLFFFKENVIKLLYTADFLNMKSLFVWQLAGDFFKILSSILAYQFLAKKLTLIYVITEILSIFIRYILSVFLINRFGFEGASMAYLFSYICYFIMMLIYFRRQLF